MNFQKYESQPANEEPAAILERELVELQVPPEVAGPVNVLTQALAQMTKEDARRVVREVFLADADPTLVAKIGPRLNEQLDPETARQIAGMAQELNRLTGGNEAVREAIASALELPPAPQDQQEPIIVHEYGPPPETETTNEKEFSPEYLVEAAAAYSLEMWSGDWGSAGAGAKTSKGISAAVLNRKESNAARQMMYGMLPEYFDFATLLERSGLAKEWIEYDHLDKGEGVVIQLDEKGVAEKKGTSTFLLAFVSATYKKPNGRESEDEVSFMCTLPPEEAEAVRAKPSLLAAMISHLRDVPERYKNIADDLTIKARLDIEPEHLPEIARRLSIAREGWPTGYNEQAIRRNIYYGRRTWNDE